MSVICIHQPDFAPYLGFFHRLLLSDHFILLDDAQYIKGGWQNRDQIKGRNGAVWLTLPIVKRFPQAINEVGLPEDQRWVEDNLNLLRECYARAPRFAEVFPRVEAVYRSGHRHMIDLNVAMLELAFDYFDIDIPISYASAQALASRSTQRLVELVKLQGGTTYLTGTGSRDYLDESLFNQAGIKVEWQRFKHPVYPQQNGDFIPMLSCLDLFFNCGRESAAVLRSTEVSTV
jgi:hypothetical protein